MLSYEKKSNKILKISFFQGDSEEDLKKPINTVKPELTTTSE